MEVRPTDDTLGASGKPSDRNTRLEGCGCKTGVDSTGKIEELESLRGVAALLVVFFHLPRWQPWLDIGLINNGYLMVELFFVLSGFVIYNAYDGRIASSRDVARFQWLRFGRLYPVHLLFLIGFVIIEIGKAILAKDVHLTEPAFSRNSLSALLQQLLLIQAIGPTGNAYTFNSPAWSISTEFYTYLLFAVIVSAITHWRHVVFSVLSIGSLAIATALGNIEGALVFLCLSGFFLGCLVCAILRRFSFVLPSWAFAFCFVGFITYLSLKTPQQMDWLVYPLSGTLIITLLRSSRSQLSGFMRARVLLWLGAISYSIYMSHSLVISLILMFIKRGMGVAHIDNDYTADAALGPTSTLLAVAASVAAVLFVSHFTFRWLEVPLRNRSRTLATRLFPSSS